MEIVPIFAGDKTRLLSASFEKDVNGEDVDEFRRVFNEWNNPVFLNDFFSERINLIDFQNFLESEISINDAIILTRNHANSFEKRLRSFFQSDGTTPEKDLNDLFKPLSKEDIDTDLARSKAYGSRKDSWLRIYAIRVSDNVYVITGGTIKLTAKMQDRKHSNDELDKFRRVKDYMHEQGMLDEDSYLELFI